MQSDPRKLALCVGINDYPARDNDLKGCVNDAKDWAEALKTAGFDVTSLHNKEATKAKIIASLQGLLEEARSGSVVVFTYSGHGTWQLDGADDDEADGRDEALCPYDVKEAKPLVDDELYEIVQENRKHGTRLIFLSDSCHSGSVARAFVEPGDSPKVRFMSPEDFMTDQRKLSKMRAARRAPTRRPSRAGALLISGCADAEYSFDASFAGRPNGAFTRLALDVLSAQKPETYGDWVAAIRKRLPSSSFPQTPQLVGTPAQRKWKIFKASGED